MSGPSAEGAPAPSAAAEAGAVLGEEAPTLAGPFEKDAEHYLSHVDWHGAPVPADRIGPWGFGFTCWYYRAEIDGDRLFFAAETPQAALSAAVAALVTAAEARGAAAERKRIAAHCQHNAFADSAAAARASEQNDDIEALVRRRLSRELSLMAAQLRNPGKSS